VKINKVLSASLVVLGMAFSHASTAQFECTLEEGILGDELTKKTEKDLGSFLYLETKKIDEQFKKSKPRNYRAFAQYKVSVWRDKFSLRSSIAQCVWDKGGRYMDPKHQTLKNIVGGFTDLNTVSISMQSYLRSGKPEKLKFIEEKLAELYALTAPFTNHRVKKPSGK